ncbi:MAG: C-terminal binding protein [Candidatus Bathyarchaeia archaeon]
MAKIVIVNSPHEDFEYEKRELSSIAEIHIARCETYEELFSAAKDADVLMIGDISHIPLRREILLRLHNVKLISVYGVSVDTIDLETAQELGITVTNAPTYGTEDVADHAVSLLLALIRRIPMIDYELRRMKWKALRSNVRVLKERFGPFRRLSSLTVGLLGFGRIGRAVARRLHPFKCKVIGYDPYVCKEIFEEYGVVKKNFKDFLSEADVISIHATLTKDTYHLLNEEAFQQMKDGVFIVNTSRGAIIDEKSLIKYLKNGKVAGAALDVFEEEPLPDNHPLMECPNVILTPHIGWYTEEAMLDQKKETTLNVKEFLLGREPPFIVVKGKRF